MVMAYGVIGNTTGFGPVILGSSPSRPTELDKSHQMMGFFCATKIRMRSLPVGRQVYTERVYPEPSRREVSPSLLVRNNDKGGWVKEENTKERERG